MDISPPPVPDLSPLQYLVLGVLIGNAVSGHVLRDELGRFGVRRTRAAFYQFMARLERDSLVDGAYVQSEAEGRLVTERRYQITGEGRAAWREARRFFQAVDARWAEAGDV